MMRDDAWKTYEGSVGQPRLFARLVARPVRGAALCGATLAHASLRDGRRLTASGAPARFAPGVDLPAVAPAL